MRNIAVIRRGAPTHWIGNGFPVRTLFSYEQLGKELSPFLMLDHAGPIDFPPSESVRGVGEHAHRGFETVTMVFSGEMEHRDSAGNIGRVGPGDVQWMTAASGVVHEEFHSPNFARCGGEMHVAQLWVNLPARAKNSSPGYQALGGQDIPCVNLPDAAGTVRVIAGEYAGRRGPARTFTPIEVWDMRLNLDGRTRIVVPAGHTLSIAVLAGTVLVNDVERLGADTLAVFAREDGSVVLDAQNRCHLLILAGEPLDEPIVGYGPFVMNTNEEIEQAITALHRGDFGQITAPLVHSQADFA